MTVNFKRPPCRYWSFCADLLNCPHLLIAGSTGSGKSVLINSIVYTALGTRTPATARFLFIDPKRVELSDYKKLKYWCYDYINDDKNVLSALDRVIDEMFNRYAQMEKNGLKMYDGSDLYIVIDEYADLAITLKKPFQTRILRIAQLGRAVKIHLIIATQRPTRDIIDAAIKTNMDYRIALHTAEAQHSRNIIGQNGAECLQIGSGYFYTPTGTEIVSTPYTEPEALRARVQYWIDNHGEIIEDEPEKMPFLRRFRKK